MQTLVTDLIFFFTELWKEGASQAFPGGKWCWEMYEDSAGSAVLVLEHLAVV